MRIKQIYLFFTWLVFMTSCGQDYNESTIKVVKIPDSIPKDLLIASFYESGHTALVFDNNSRTSGKMINYFGENQVESHDIIPIGKNKFSCQDNNNEYEVLETTVMVIHGGEKAQISLNNLPLVETFDRTDK